MQKGIVKILKLVVSIVIVSMFVWFLVLSPMLTFHSNEKKIENAAKRYFELNSDKLPTGERVKTLSLSALYKEAYLDTDFYIPLSKKVCSIEKSWVKIRKENGKYVYYTYLDCGILKSSVDHDGPVIKLNGDEEVTVSIGDKYKELGVNSVIDSNDGKIKNDLVSIKSNVNTNKIGVYTVTYSAFDNLSNKGVVTRTVKVVKTVKSVVKKELGEATNYVGNPDNNYVRLSNMLYRIYGINNDDNVILVSNEDVANVNHSKIEKWLDDYYYEHLNDYTKKIIVKSKFCNMTIDEANLDTTQCNSYTDKRYTYIPSIIDVNKAEGNDENFMRPSTMSWVANKKDGKDAYLTRIYFFGDQYGKRYLSYSYLDNYGVRPMFVIKGDSYIQDGDGSYINPYTFGDTKKAKGSSLLNTRFTGEYIENKGNLWRIIDTLEDGTTKVISSSTIFDSNGERLSVTSMPGASELIYNPKQKDNVAYYINNKISNNIDTSIFVNHDIKVPIYNKRIVYGEEKKTKTYNVKFSAPNIYEMFSAFPTENSGALSYSYWLINSVKGARREEALQDVGVPLNRDVGDYDYFGARVVGYVKNSVVISSGSGTISDPYRLK